MSGLSANDEPSKIVLYQAADGKVTINVLFARENFWLTQKVMADLFGVKPPAVSKHLKNIFASGELLESAVVSILETTAADGKTYATNYYNLDAAIAVGYRVNSLKATHFRIWATTTLREFIVKGFVINDTQLKNGRAFGQDYFDELLKGSGRYGRASAVPTRRSPTSSSSAAAIIGATARKLSTSTKSFKITCTSPPQARRPPRSFTSGPTPRSPSWV